MTSPDLFAQINVIVGGMVRCYAVLLSEIHRCNLVSKPIEVGDINKTLCRKYLGETQTGM